MEDFSGYTHIESDVEAVQSTPETQGFIAAQLMNELARDYLLKYTANASPETKSVTFTFQYKDQSPAVLNENDYLVRINTGHFVVVPKDKFEEFYIHSELDPIITKPKKVKDIVAEFAAKKHQDLKIKKASDLTTDNLTKLAEAAKNTFLSGKVFTLDFSECTITEAYGLTDMMNVFINASYMTEDVTLRFKFSNGVQSDITDAEIGNNSFSYIGLESIIGEFDHMVREVFTHPIEIQLLAESSDTSPVAPSVTSAQWETFTAAIKSIAGGEEGSVNIMRG